MSYGGAKRYFQNDSQTPISLSHVYIAGIGLLLLFKKNSILSFLYL